MIRMGDGGMVKGWGIKEGKRNHGENEKNKKLSTTRRGGRFPRGRARKKGGSGLDKRLAKKRSNSKKRPTVERTGESSSKLRGQKRKKKNKEKKEKKKRLIVLPSN